MKLKLELLLIQNNINNNEVVSKQFAVLLTTVYFLI